MDTRSKVAEFLTKSFASGDDDGKYGVVLEFFLYNPEAKLPGRSTRVFRNCVDLGWEPFYELGINGRNVLSGAFDPVSKFKIFAEAGLCMIEVNTPQYPTLQELDYGLREFLLRLVAIIELGGQYLLSSPIWPNLTPIEDDLSSWWFGLSRYSVLKKVLSSPKLTPPCLSLSLSRDHALAYFLNLGVDIVTATAGIKPHVRLSGIGELPHALSLFNFITPVIHALFAEPSLHHGNELRLFGMRDLLWSGVSNQSGMYENIFKNLEDVVDLYFNSTCFFTINSNGMLHPLNMPLSSLNPKSVDDFILRGMLATQWRGIRTTHYGSLELRSFCQIAGGGSVGSYVQKVMRRVAFVAGVMNDLPTAISLIDRTGWKLGTMREADMQTYMYDLGMLRHNTGFMGLAKSLVALAYFSLEAINAGDGECFGLKDMYLKLHFDTYFPRDCSLIDHVLQKGCDSFLIDQLRLKE